MHYNKIRKMDVSNGPGVRVSIFFQGCSFHCPNCGNRDHNTLNVARRTCGYIGSNFWNKGRTQEIKERVLHIDNKDDE